MKNQQGAPEALRPIQRYKIGYHTDEWGVRSSTPGGISDPSGQWVLYKDHIAALVEAQQPAPSAAAAVVVYEQKENEMQVWFRPARMHGHPERTPIKATITKDRGNGIVDLTYDDGEFSGNARAVPNALRLPRNVREQVAVWWDVGFEMDFQTAVDNSLKKKKDDPPPQPSPTPQADIPAEQRALLDAATCEMQERTKISTTLIGVPTPQADSQPAPVRDEREAFEADYLRTFPGKQGRLGRTKRTASIGYEHAMVQCRWEGWQARAASTPADSVTAPAGGVADGWKWAPEEPTLDMGWAYLDAARESEPLRTHTFNHAGYRAMLAAAPTPPAQPNPLRAALLKCIAVIERTAHCNEADRLAAADEARQALAAQAADSVLEDAARLDWLQANSCDLRCVGVPTGGDDYDINWVVIEHYEAKPHEREIGRSYQDDPRGAIDAARKQGANHD